MFTFRLFYSNYLKLCSWFAVVRTARGVRKLLQTHYILNNHWPYWYKTSTTRMTDCFCTLCINILDIHKLVLLQFRLLSGVLIDTVLKIVRKLIENVAEIMGYIKYHCKLGLSVKSIHDEICVVYRGSGGRVRGGGSGGAGDKLMSFSTVNIIHYWSGISQRCSLFRYTQVCSYEI